MMPIGWRSQVLDPDLVAAIQTSHFRQCTG